MLNHIIAYNPFAWLGDKIFTHIHLFQNLANFFRNLVINTNSTSTQKLLFTLGISTITYKIIHNFYRQCKFWNWAPQHTRNVSNYHPQKFKQKYGDCYVLITGAADGIGYAYARQFAKLGFKLIITDIQQNKLQHKKNQLQSLYPNIKVQAFVTDMSNINQIHQFINIIQKYDIGIVINNVGLSGGGKYLQIQPNTIKKTLIVNYIPAYEINKLLIPKLRIRPTRSAIINMSSATGVYISHRTGVYSSIKLLSDLYSRTLSKQNNDRIDIISVRPFGVTTGMMKMRKQQRFITPKQCVVSVLRDLGNTDATFSGYNHKILGAFFGTLSQEQALQLYQLAWK